MVRFDPVLLQYWSLEDYAHGRSSYQTPSVDKEPGAQREGSREYQGLSSVSRLPPACVAVGGLIARTCHREEEERIASEGFSLLHLVASKEADAKSDAVSFFEPHYQCDLRVYHDSLACRHEIRNALLQSLFHKQVS